MSGGPSAPKVADEGLRLGVTAVSRVLFGRTRVESDRCVVFKSYYGFDTLVGVDKLGWHAPCGLDLTA
jgi:hypothetical protein